MKKEIHLIVLIFSFILTLPVIAGNYELLKKCNSDESIPFALFDTYSQFVIAMEKGNPSLIRNFCTTNVISINEEKPITFYEMGKLNEINIYFATNGFDKYIIKVEKLSEDNYLIRTSSTAMWFTRITNQIWRITKYLDKPIE